MISLKQEIISIPSATFHSTARAHIGGIDVIEQGWVIRDRYMAEVIPVWAKIHSDICDQF